MGAWELRGGLRGASCSASTASNLQRALKVLRFQFCTGFNPKDPDEHLQEGACGKWSPPSPTTPDSEEFEASDASGAYGLTHTALAMSSILMLLPMSISSSFGTARNAESSERFSDRGRSLRNQLSFPHAHFQNPSQIP